MKNKVLNIYIIGAQNQMENRGGVGRLILKWNRKKSGKYTKKIGKKFPLYFEVNTNSKNSEEKTNIKK